MRLLVALVFAFIVGVTTGGYFFSRSLPRSFLAFDTCSANCLTKSELAGLLVSAGLQRGPRIAAVLEIESDTCVAVKHPKPAAKFHYVLFPKHDVKNIASLTDDDQQFVMGCFALVRRLVERDQLKNYYVSTNGPGLQEIAYLHFHLIAKSADS